MQVWEIDEHGFYKYETKLLEKSYDAEGKPVEPILTGYTTIPLMNGYIKPKLVNSKWVEGATPEEIKVWEEANQLIAEPDKIEVKLSQIEEAIGILATQTAKNTLLNGGIR